MKSYFWFCYIKIVKYNTSYSNYKFWKCFLCVIGRGPTRPKKFCRCKKKQMQNWKKWYQTVGARKRRQRCCWTASPQTSRKTVYLQKDLSEARLEELKYLRVEVASTTVSTDIKVLCNCQQALAEQSANKSLLLPCVRGNHQTHALLLRITMVQTRTLLLLITAP